MIFDQHRHRPLMLVLCAASILVTGCNKLDSDKIEASIKEKFASEGIELTAADCPGDRKLAAGDEFDCSARSDRGDAFNVHVKQTNAEGSVTWTYNGVIVDPKKLFKGVFDCGDKKFIAVKGTKVTCKLRDKAVEVTFIDDHGTLDDEAIKELISQ